MKNKIKILTTMFMTIFMVCGLATTAFAVNTSLPPQKGTLTIHKYLMEDASQAAGPNNGHEAGSNGNPAVPATAKPINGIKFDLYQVTIPAGGQVPAGGDYTVDNLTNATKLTSGAQTFDVTKKETVTTAGGTAEAPLGEAKSGSLEQGFYLVIEQTDPRVNGPAAPFVVAVPMTNPQGDGWIQDVHVYPKNEDLSAKKDSSVTSVKLGETMTWTIQSSVPTDITAAKKFNVSDPLDQALTYKPGSVVVAGLTADGAATGTILTETTDWTATLDSATNQLTVSFTQAGLEKLANYKFVKINLDTTVNDKILTYADHSVQNKATVSYTNRFDEPKTRDTQETKIHTGSMVINMTDANDNKGTNVAGAQLQIASSENNAKAGNFLKKTADGKIVDFGETGYDTAQPWIETTAEGTDTVPATAKFQGLKDYAEAQNSTDVQNFTNTNSGTKAYLSYWLAETKAPSGYNLLAAPVKVDFTAENSTEATIYTVTTAIKNTTDFTLPKTGGMGTILFIAGGIALIGLAAILLIVFRKKIHIK